MLLALLARIPPFCFKVCADFPILPSPSALILSRGKETYFGPRYHHSLLHSHLLRQRPDDFRDESPLFRQLIVQRKPVFIDGSNGGLPASYVNAPGIISNQPEHLIIHDLPTEQSVDIVDQEDAAV